MKSIVSTLFLFFTLCTFGQSLEEYFPLKLFFPNDEPDPKTISSITKTTYQENYKSYELQFEDYKKRGSMFESLLESEIIPNYQKLPGLRQTLVDTLKKGKRVVLQIKGFASPLNNTFYNLKISQRRISSFINELKTDDKSITSDDGLIDFINNGQLIFVELPFGEYSANHNINDKLDSLDFSVYHISPSYERRIEIEKILILDINAPYLYSEKSFHDLGKIKKGELIKMSFPIQNLGKESLKIERIAVSCGCSVANIQAMELAPLQKSTLDVEIDTKELFPGKEVKSFTVYYNNGVTKRYTVMLDLQE